MPRSMTGFARIEQVFPWGHIACELRSVNHRYLEPTLRLPDSLKAIENTFRASLKKQLNRGKVEASVFLRIEQGEQSTIAMNEAMSSQVQRLAEQIASKLENPAKINPLEILKWPGVLESAQIDKDTLEEAALVCFDDALTAIVANREREGAELKTFIEQRLSDIAKHVAEVRIKLPEILDAHQSKLRERLDALKVEVDEERLAQELVFVAQKADVAEELDRLEAHLNEVKLTLNQQQPTGRRLDFLMQELNREANTLSSKSMASETTQHAVDLKVLIEQMREQVQNIE